MRHHRSRRLGSWSISMETATVQAHVPECQFSTFASPEKTNTLRVGYSGLVGLFARALNISFYLKCSAGGASISSRITYHLAVNEHRAPAFRLISTLMDGASSISAKTEEAGLAPDGESIKRLFLYCWHKLRRVYQEGKGSPRDTDLYGASLIHFLHTNTLSAADTGYVSIPYQSVNTWSQASFLQIYSMELISCI